ncbi:MAG: peptidylprolyl isomerase [Leptolyngbyaceae bacterium]|nr:peptidylprolyl isomerase [Leptolyngbyaceae bacterium]
MSDMLKIGTRTIASDNILPLLAGYQMMPQFLKEVLIDEAIADIDCTDEEKEEAYQTFYQQNQLTEPDHRRAWLNHYQMNEAQLQSLATRELRIEKFKQQKWGPKLESYFLDRKGKLDKVIYSLIRTKDIGIAQELYFRISEGEQTFAEMAREYSQGPESQTDGLIGPVELSVPHPSLAHMLSISQPGQLCPPTRVGEWVVIVRLERFIPAQLDDGMRQRLLNEAFNEWIKEQLQGLHSSDSNGAASTSNTESSTAQSSENQEHPPNPQPSSSDGNPDTGSTDSKITSVAP